MYFVGFHFSQTLKILVDKIHTIQGPLTSLPESFRSHLIFFTDEWSLLSCHGDGSVWSDGHVMTN